MILEGMLIVTIAVVMGLLEGKSTVTFTVCGKFVDGAPSLAVAIIYTKTINITFNWTLLLLIILCRRGQ